MNEMELGEKLGKMVAEIEDLRRDLEVVKGNQGAVKAAIEAFRPVEPRESIETTPAGRALPGLFYDRRVWTTFIIVVLAGVALGLWTLADVASLLLRLGVGVG